MHTLHLKSGHETRIKNGHLWAFAGEIVEPLKGLTPGDPVALCEARGGLLGRGYVNPHSLIAVRLLTRGQEPFDEGLIRRRIESAWRYRSVPGTPPPTPPASGGDVRIGAPPLTPPAIAGGDSRSTACRLIYSESDGLPGLIVDRFGDQLVVQSLTAGIEVRLDDIVQALVEVANPRGVYLKGKSPFRKMEGLTEEDRQLWGETPAEVQFEDDGAKWTAHIHEGQKSGYYLDQRGNRELLKRVLDSRLPPSPRHAERSEASRPTNVVGDEILHYVQDDKLARPYKVLDLYSYTGGWGITALLAGAKEAIMVDSSARAIKWGIQDAALNGVEDRALFIEADVEAFLKEAVGQGRKWEVVVADPPALIPNRQSVAQGINAYIAVNRAALRVVAPGGILVTCSCSHLMTREKHLEVIGRAAFQEDRRVRVIAAGGHPYDHPILPGHPETEYLKCWILTVD